MKDIPQELTIAFNVGKGVSNLFFVLTWLALYSNGGHTIKYGFTLAILPYPVYIYSKWFIFTIHSHKQNLNVYKVLETKEVLDDSIVNLNNN